MRFHKWEQHGYASSKKHIGTQVICHRCNTIATWNGSGILVVTGDIDKDHTVVDRDCEKQEIQNKIYDQVKEIVDG
jgi:hypothetical protein